MSKIVKKNNESIQKAIVDFFKKQQMPIVGDDVLEIMARLEFCYEQLQVLKVSLSGDREGLSNIKLKREVIKALQSEFDISYTQATVDYKRATMIFNMSLVDTDTLHYDILFDDLNELYGEVLQAGKFEIAEKLIARRESLLKNRPKQVQAPVNNRPKMIFAEWNPALLKFCEVIEDQEALIELERKVKAKFQHQTKTASSLLNSYADDIESTPVE